MMYTIRCAPLAGLTCFFLMIGLCPASVDTPGAPCAGDEISAALPVIPDRKFNLLDFGGQGDYQALNTDAFNRAVAAIAKEGGGHLVVPAGVYKTLPFALTSHMDLHLEAGATIKAPDNFVEYGLPDPEQPLPQKTAPGGLSEAELFNGQRKPEPLISGKDLTDVAITGSGTIDGSGAKFWEWSDKAANRFPRGRRIVGRPELIRFTNVKRLHVDGVTLTNSPMFHLVPTGDDLTIENLRVIAPANSPNTDAIDPAGHRIVIRNCVIDTGDDNVALHGGTADVLIEKLTCLHGHGISVGSGTRGGLSHVIVRDCTFEGTDNGLRIKSCRGRGGEVKDFLYANITMKNVRRPFDINMRYNGNAPLPPDVGPREADPEQTRDIPDFHDIRIEGLTVAGSPIAGRILGIPERMPRAITFTRVAIEANRGFLVQDAKEGIVFDQSEITVKSGEPLVTSDAIVTFNGVVRRTDSNERPESFY